jgi:hypothetical protein
MGGLPMTFPDVNQSGVEFVLIDLDVGMTFMDVADASRVADTMSRNHNNARRAYDAVLRLSES